MGDLSGVGHKIFSNNFNKNLLRDLSIILFHSFRGLQNEDLKVLSQE